MMDIAKLKELVGLMKSHDLTEIELKGDQESVVIKRGTAALPTMVQYAPPPAAVAAVGVGGSPSAPSTPPTPAGTGTFIESPMVGTFYASPNPDAAAFVKPGQSVTPDTVVCIIEAMKVFNEIKAEKAGVVESMLVKNGQAVEFGQKLFSLRNG